MPGLSLYAKTTRSLVVLPSVGVTRCIASLPRNKTRSPGPKSEGDVWAAIAACRIGARRLGEVAEKYGIDTFTEAMVRHMDHGEALARQALKELPKGTWEISEEQDNGAVLNATITISNDEFIVDLRNNPEQNTDPNNCSRDAVMVAAQMIFKSLTAPNTAASAGSFRPITLLTEPGTIFDAQAPAPHGFYYELELRAYDLLWRCLAPVVPDIFGAGHFASVCGTFVGGVHPDTGRQYTIIEPQLGGWGATRERDGNHAMFSGFHGETYNCPAEINEIRNGLFIERMELNTEPGRSADSRNAVHLAELVREQRLGSTNTSTVGAFAGHGRAPTVQRGG